MGRGALGREGGAAAGSLGRPASRQIFFLLSAHVCVCEDHQELPTPGRVGSVENVVVVVDI